MHKQMYSETLKTMLATHTGYRNESYSGSGVRDLMDVIYFEIEELDNMDILYTMSKFYGLDFSNYIETEDDYEFVHPECYQKVFDVIAGFVEKKLSADRKNLEAIWLTTKEAVDKIYSKYGKKVTGYSFTEDWIPISDLGEDGTLFVYKKGEGA